MTRNCDGVVVPGVDHRLDLLVGPHGQHRLHQHALGGALLAGDLVGLDPVHLAPVGEEQQVGVGGGVHQVA